MRSLRAGDPERIGDYRLLGRLGEGGMGRVYLAQSPRGRTVAVKLVRRELAEDPEFRQRFEQEIHAARRVGGEWTAPVLDADTEAELPWVATGYIPGIPLHEAVAGRGTPLPERTLRILANRLARALGAVHDAGLIHRDVKPSNILVTIDGPRVIDFGIARALETVAEGRLTRTGAVVGSPAFMSPEQVRGERLTGASDVFSLGSVLAFAATGRTPFGGSASSAGHVLMFRITQEDPHLDGVPEGLLGLVTDCLAKDPAARPALADVLARTADPDEAPGPSATSPDAEPWLPAALVAHLGRHAASLLDAEVPGARAAAARAAEAPAVPPPPATPPAPAAPPGGAVPDEGTPGAGAPGVGAADAGAASVPPAPAVPPVPPAPTMPPSLPAAEGTGVEGSTPVRDTPVEGASGPDGPVSAPPPASDGDGGAAALPTVTGHPQGGAPPPPPGGSGSGYGYGYPGGTAPLPAAAPPERRSRRGLVLAASALALALVAGVGTFTALRVLDSSGDDRKNEGAREPSKDTAGKPTDAASADTDEGDGKPRTPAPGGALPRTYLGAWQGTVSDNGETVTRRFEIRQGETGDVVAKTFNLRKDLLCEGAATLVSYAGAMRVTSEITESHPASPGCSPYKEQELKLRSDGRMEWSSTAEGLTAELRRVNGAAKPVPARMLGRWEGHVGDDEKDRRVLRFEQRRVGEVAMRITANGAGYHCEWDYTLGASDGTVLMYGPATTRQASPAAKCRGQAQSFAVRLDGDSRITVSNVDDEADTPRTYRRAD